MEAGRDVLIVYDDLTQHARAYRELSLLLRRPPGREAFPGDIFYIHSRMLERATHLSKELGGGSLTALPIIETEAQDISAYIPTNLISITDGQIYLSPSLFELGVLPAVDVGKSVSRVGGKAQRAAYRAVAGDLKLAYAQFEELETFARFGARLDEDTRKIIEHGRRIRACLKQPEFAPVSVPAQIAVLLALTAGLFDRVPLEQMTDAEHAVQEAAAKIPAEVRARFETADKLSDEDRKAIIEIARQALVPFSPSRNPTQSQGRSEAERTPKPSPSSTRIRAEAHTEPNRSPSKHQGEAMSDSTASLRRKIDSAGDLQSVVRTMKAMAASSIGQYEKSVRALADYYRTVELGLAPAFGKASRPRPSVEANDDPIRGAIGAIVFGSDQGLVANLTTWWPIMRSRHSPLMPGKPRVWAVGERVHARLADAGLPLMGSSPCRIPSRPSRRLSGRYKSKAKRIGPGEVRDFTSSITARLSRALYEPVGQRLLPLDANGVRGWPEFPGRPEICPRSWAAATATLRASFANIFSSRFSVPAPNHWRARMRAAWRPWNAPTRTSTNCWKSSTAHSIVCARAVSTRNFSTWSPASRR